MKTHRLRDSICTTVNQSINRDWSKDKIKEERNVRMCTLERRNRLNARRTLSVRWMWKEKKMMTKRRWAVKRRKRNRMLIQVLVLVVVVVCCLPVVATSAPGFLPKPLTRAHLDTRGVDELKANHRSRSPKSQSVVRLAARICDKTTLGWLEEKRRIRVQWKTRKRWPELDWAVRYNLRLAGTEGRKLSRRALESVWKCCQQVVKCAPIRLKQPPIQRLWDQVILLCVFFDQPKGKAPEMVFVRYEQVTPVRQKWFELFFLKLLPRKIGKQITAVFCHV